MAEQAFRAVEPDLGTAMHACAGGRELADKGFAEDVDVAAEVDAGFCVPVLTDEGCFTDAR